MEFQPPFIHTLPGYCCIRYLPFLLEHGQTVGWLRYERMAAPPERLYGQDVGSNYQGQGLKLAKQFAQAE